MREIHDRAFKEWAVACEAMKAGRQTVLIRKGGIREEDGVFRVEDSEFFLLPTYDHQSASLLKSRYIPDLDRIKCQPHNPREVQIDAYAVVDTVAALDNEERLRQLDGEHIWNDEYLRLRLDFNPYDPLYVLLLRVYRLTETVRLDMRPEYGGCKSWVTLDRPISTAGAVPALSDQDFERRKADLLRALPPAVLP